MPLEPVGELAGASETQAKESVGPLDNFARNPAAEIHGAAWLRQMAGLELSPGLVVGDDPLDQHLHAAAGRLHTKRACADDARVVQDREVALAQQRRQIDETPVGERIAVDVEQAAPASRRRGRLRDQVLRQRVIEIGERVAAILHRWLVGDARHTQRRRSEGAALSHSAPGQLTR